jgi:hypothetical protein
MRRKVGLAMSTNDEIKTGLLGWFDILGYKSFLEKNDLAYAAEVIREVIAKAQPEGIRWIERILACIPDGMQEEKSAGQEALKSIRWSIFSDTVVLAVSLPPPNFVRSRYLIIGVFLELAKNLCVDFFSRGLPLRGAISFGQFYLHDSPPILATKPLIAHELAEAQQWSGCVFDSSAESEVSRVAAGIDPDLRDVFMSNTVRHPVTFRWKRSDQSETKTMLCLNWPNMIDRMAIEMSWPEFVEREFARHNKDISRPDVQVKIKNTAEFIMHVKGLQTGNQT